MMRAFLLAVISCIALAGSSSAADQQQLRKLEAPAPISLSQLPNGSDLKSIRLTRALVQPAQGVAWALVYSSFTLQSSDAADTPPDELLPWQDGPSNRETPAFARIFDEELKAAGFSATGEGSLFEERTATDLQAGVVIDDIKGRFCRNCPTLFQRDKVSAVVTMSARWEVYSSLRGQVVARIPTNAGATWRKPIQGNTTAVVFDAFRENVRALLASESFRAAVSGSAKAPAKTILTPISFAPSPLIERSLADAAGSVAAVFTGDGHGSAFLISRDGYLLTNHHVVSGAKYVKIRWADGSDVVGEVLRSDRRRDVALIKAEPGRRQPLALRPSTPALGAPVYAVGTPLDAKFQGSVTRGIVSAARTYEDQRYIQSDVVINGGNSGGPLLDEAGAVLGIAVSGMEIGGAPVGINLFIPIDEALSTLALSPAG